MLKDKTTALRPSLFGKSNYMWMLAGLAVIVLGYLLMAGGKSDDPRVWEAAEVNSARRITIAPLLIIIGFLMEIYAILKRPKEAVPAASI